MAGIDEMKKNATNSVKAEIKEPIKKEVKKSLSDEFLEELDEQEAEIFTQLKSVLIDTCELMEFEAITEDSLDDFRALITYTKNGILTIENDGINIKLRRSILNSDGEKLTDSVKILFEKNDSRERIFTKGIKVLKKDIESQKSFTRACLAASFANIEIGGRSVILNAESISEKKIHNKDYMLLLTCYNFFRN
ncbi:MAG: hypothetical protein PF485_05710 [Bacteroidales bacterium]|jgi:hypothetical protein|nr:hypothetical protein [Bacteroidales bacterium]